MSAGDGGGRANAALIAGVPLLRGVGAAAVDAIVELGDFAFVPSGATLLSADRARSLVVLLEGTAESRGSEGEPTRHGPGAVLGTASLFAAVDRLRPVIASSDVVALVLRERAVTELIHAHPVVGERLVRLLAHRLTEPRVTHAS